MGYFIYVVVLEGRTVRYLSFLDPKHVYRRGLSPLAVVGELGPDGGLDPDTFRVNGPFLDLLHRVVSERFPSHRGLLSEARAIGDGHVYVIDPRAGDPRGRVPPDDILGYFRVVSGRIVKGSYQPNPNYRVLTERGLTRIPEGLEKELLAALNKLASIP